MKVDDSIPIIYSYNLNVDPSFKPDLSRFKMPTSIQRFSERYLSSSHLCYKINAIESNGKMCLSLEKQPHAPWYVTLLKVASYFLTLGLLPLLMWTVKNQHRRQYQKYFFLPQYSHSPFKKLPEEVLAQIIVMAITPGQPLACVDKACNEAIKKYPWQKIFNSMTSINFEEITDEWRRELEEKRHQQKLIEFSTRIKKLYTNGREPTFQEKVWYLCLEMWEDALQVPETQHIIQNEKLTMAHLMGPQYQRFKTLIQPTKDANLVSVAKMLAEQEPFRVSLLPLIQKNIFKEGNLEKQASLIRDWFETTMPVNLTLAKEIDLTSEKLNMLSTEIITYFMRMSNLESLNLSRFFLDPPEYKITVIPSAIGNLDRLKVLNFSRNALSSLPKTIDRLINLKEIYLNFNHFSVLPEAIGHLDQLEEIRLFDNQLNTLPDSIGNLKKLHTLSLHLNPMSTLPLAMAKLTCLQKLFVGPELREFIGKTPELKFLEKKIF